jgi:hypothetical protein
MLGATPIHKAKTEHHAWHGYSMLGAAATQKAKLNITPGIGRPPLAQRSAILKGIRFSINTSIQN